jgi:hypothetical protein
MRGRRSSARSGPHGDRVPDPSRTGHTRKSTPGASGWTVPGGPLQIQFPLRLTAYAGGRFRSVRWRAAPHG